MLHRAEAQGLLHGIKVARYAPSVSQLMFVDDLLIFCRANGREVMALNDNLSRYTKWSRQLVSFSKSSIYCRLNTHPEIIASMQKILQLKTMTTNRKYLGLPLFLGKSKKVAFEEVKEKVLKKEAGWRPKPFLNQGE